MPAAPRGKRFGGRGIFGKGEGKILNRSIEQTKKDNPSGIVADMLFFDLLGLATHYACGCIRGYSGLSRLRRF